MSTKHSTTVIVAGESYNLKSDMTPERTHEVAARVDREIAALAAHPGATLSHRVAVQAAMSIAGELFRVQDERAALATEMRALSSELRRWLPPAKRVTGAQAAQE
ncbi:MAG: cell division protein ZapA [Gemmatimonadetes bacterium]|nr:cell division protein ZapA [Gemmatimonadota bacterium]